MLNTATVDLQFSRSLQVKQKNHTENWKFEVIISDFGTGDFNSSKNCHIDSSSKLDLRCMGNVRYCGNLCLALPSKVLQEHHFGFVSSL